MVAIIAIIQSLTSFVEEGSNMETAPDKMEPIPDNVQLEHLWMLYVGSLFSVSCLIILIYFNRGFWVTFGVFTYIMSLSTMTLSVKWVFVHEKFNYPLFLTSTHFFSCGVLCFIIMLIRQKSGTKPLHIPTRRQMTSVVLPIAACFTASVATNNFALVHCNAAFVEMIGGATPLCLVWLKVVEGRGFNWNLLGPVVMVVGGVCMCVTGELHFTRIGFMLVWSSTMLRAVKQHLQGKIMERNTDIGTLEPIELLAWMSVPCFAMMFFLGFFIEGTKPYLELHNANTPGLSMAIGLTIVNAWVLNVANNVAIRDLGAMGCALAGQLKSILLLMGAAVLLQEVVSRQQIAGYCLLTCGVYFYNKMDKTIREGDPKDLEALHERISEALKDNDKEKTPLLK